MDFKPTCEVCGKARTMYYKYELCLCDDCRRLKDREMSRPVETDVAEEPAVVPAKEPKAKKAKRKVARKKK